MSDFLRSVTNITSKDSKDSKDSKEPKERDVTAVKNLIGLTIHQVDETLISDLDALIKGKIRNGLEGYLHCLSRLMRHDIAWEIVVEAFRLNEQKPPSKYAHLFGRDESGKSLIRSNSRWTVG